MDLYVWRAPRVTETDDADRLVRSEDESVFESSAAVERFYAKPPEAFTEEELEGRPDSVGRLAHGTDRLVWLSMRWSANDEHLDGIVELARRHDLVLYDAQGPSFHSPPGENEDAAYVPTIGEYVRGVIIAAFGVLVALLAWKASIPVVSCIVIFVGGFVTLVAQGTTLAVTYEAWRDRASGGP
jgi:hypothetical protein